METDKQQPPFEIANDKIQQTDHSLSADLAMGWRPKLKVIGPIPLNFDNAYIDKSIKDLLKSEASIYKVIYLGPRPLNTYKMHEVLKKKYKYKYQHLFSVEYGQLKAFFHKFYGQFQPKMKMPFLGMNPIFKQHKLSFDSCFQSGNLDCVIKVGDAQYDLILRIDSNTNGHIMWYYFKVKNTENTNHNQICVETNPATSEYLLSLHEGMKPFIRRKKKYETEDETNQEWTEWQQGGQNVQITQQKLRFEKQTFIFDNGKIEVNDQQILFRRLSFEVEFQPFEEMQFAYSVPYTYSDLLSDIKDWRQSIIDRGAKNVHFAVDTRNQSLSGLEIPVITITEKQGQFYDLEKQKLKQSVYIIGRQHPGESNGSWVMKGFISQLISDDPEIKFLLKHLVFTIVPMLNVDGVVLGNFRTSLYGKDLNRLFKKQQLFLIPEVQMCKQEFNRLIKVFKTKIMLFMDFHGHSARRNAFCYGPGILDSNAFNDVREFAKIIASKTEIFRYPSCSFRIDSDKKTTARACFSKSVRLAYTIQSSNWSFYSRSQGKMLDFTSQYWQSIGIDIANSLTQYAEDKISKNKGKQKKNNKSKNQKSTVSKIIEKRNLNGEETGIKAKKVVIEKESKESPRKRFNRVQTTKQIPQVSEQKTIPPLNKSKQQQPESQKITDSAHLHRESSQMQQTSKSTTLLKMQQIEQQQNQSDNMSDNEMDSDSQGEDMQRSKFQRYMNGAKKMMIEFEKVYLGDQYEKKGRTASKVRQEKLLARQSRNLKKNSQVIACLRKKQPIERPSQLQNSMGVQVNTNRLLQIQRSKPLSQPSRKPIVHAMQLNTKQIQFQYQQPQQQQQIAKKILLAGHKAKYQKILLPRIQESYQLKRKKQYLQDVNMIMSDDKVQQWTYGESMPQHLVNKYNERQVNYVNSASFKRSAFRQKSISNYQRRTKINRVDFYYNANQKQQLSESQSDKQQHINSQYHQLQESNVLYQNITHRQNYPLLTQSAQNPNLLRYSIKSSPNHPNIQTAIGRAKMQLEQMKKISLIKELNDPISRGYRQVGSLQELKNAKDKNQPVVEIEGFGVLRKDFDKKQAQDKKHFLSFNNSKIKEIILNNLKSIKNNNSRCHTRKNQQNLEQMLHMQTTPIENDQFYRDSIAQSLESGIGRVISSSNNKYTSPQKSSNLLFTKGPQQIISASAILPNPNKQQTQIIRTLESQSLPKHIEQFKVVKNSISNSKNYSEKLRDLELDILKQEDKINRSPMKFNGDLLPKLSQQGKKSPQQKFAKSKISLHKQIDEKAKESPTKGEKISRIKPITSVNPSQKDPNNIKLLINGRESHRQSTEQQKPNSKKTSPSKHSNRQFLINRLKQLESEGREEFGQRNLLSNKQSITQRENSSGLYAEIKQQVQSLQYEGKSLQRNKKIKTNVTEMTSRKQAQSKKEMKIFSLPVDRFSFAINSSKHNMK